MSVEAVLSENRGMIVAPAGCGKTHLIIEALKIKPTKPYLVLTHTTAGVAALKQRLKHQGVPGKHYKVSTIDGLALRIINTFPCSCVMRVNNTNPGTFYPELRRVVNAFLNAGHIEEIIHATYSRIFVDEYQDCDIPQHNMTSILSKCLPTIALGDPMQAIFNFGNITLPNWNQVVIAQFPLITTLNTPWRWNNADKHELGQWILNVRNILEQGSQIDLQSCPNHVDWHQLTGNAQIDIQNQTNMQYHIRNHNPDMETLLVIGDSKNRQSRHNFARTANGIDVVEPVELADITDAASNFDVLQGIQLVEHVLTVAGSMMSGVGKVALLQRVKTIAAGRNRTPANFLELAAKGLLENSSRESIQNLLQQLEQTVGCNVYRRGAYSALKDTILMSISNPSQSINEAASIVREQRRYHGDRRIPMRAIGSTLLLKGLEADHSLTLDAGRMNSRHLYVALSRGAKSVTVFSRSNIVGF